MPSKVKKPMMFKLHGQPFDPSGNSTIFLKIGKITKLLEEWEDGEILDSAELAAKLSLTQRGIADYNGKLRELGMSLKIGAKNFYGNPETVAALKQRLEA